MAYRNLEVSNRGAVHTITINRPATLNALNRATLNELRIAFTQAAQDDSVRVVILAGAGDKAFVAGADISEMKDATPHQAQSFALAGQRLMTLIAQLGKPVIARLQGYALGGGLELAMACHLRIASDRARLGQPEVKLGIVPGFGGTQRLARLAGRAATLELCLTGNPIDATRAAQLGLVNRVVPAEQLDATVSQLADELAARAPIALATILDVVLNGNEGGLDQGLNYEAQGFALTFATADSHEGMNAFLEKRAPDFHGR